MQRTVDAVPALDPLVAHVRPALVWLGIAAFFGGSMGVSAWLAARQLGTTGPDPAAGLALLSFGVAYVGIGLALSPTTSRYDPEIDLPDWGRVLLATLAGPFLVGGVLALTLAL